MPHRMILVALVLALTLSASPIADAADTTTIRGTVVPTSTVSLGSGYVVVRLFRGATNEIGRDGDSRLVSFNRSTYTFSLANVKNSELNQRGPFTVKAYILDGRHHIYYYSQVDYQTLPRTGLTIRVARIPNAGIEILPTGSAGTLLLLVGILAVILAGGVALWRRRRSRALAGRFA